MFIFDLSLMCKLYAILHFSEYFCDDHGFVNSMASLKMRVTLYMRAFVGISLCLYLSACMFVVCVCCMYV